MNYFLLKRNPDIAGRIGKKFTSSGIHWYVNTQNGGYPSHSKSLEVNVSARRLSRTERYLGKRLSPRAKLEPFDKKPD